MTKAILEIEPSGSSLARAVPSTLQALLMTRLDRLGLVTKDVAQAGAAIGREFGFGLLAAVTDLPEPQLCKSLIGSRAPACFSSAALHQGPTISSSTR